MSIPETNGIFAEHYLLKEQLSAGRVEEVWKAEDWSAEGAPVTIRLYAPHIRLDPHSLELLHREQEQRAALQHPHLLVPAGFGVYQGVPYEVAPLQPQQTLAQRLLLHGALPEREIALLVSQISSALTYLHSLQPPLAHRQINPDNILLDASGTYLLAVPALSNQLRTLLHRATGTPLAQGTAYAAPELFGSHPVHTSSSDVFALGVSLYELCTGETPWLGNGGLSLSQGAEIPIVPAPYSRILSNLVRACLNPDPEKRPSAQVLIEEANYYLEHGNWKPYGTFGDVTAESIVYRNRPRWVWPVLLLLVTGALAAAYYFLIWKAPDQPDEIATSTSTSLPVQRQTSDTSVSVRTAEAEQPDTPAAQKEEPRKAKATQKKAATAAKPAPTRPVQPAYPQPNSLEDYLVGLLNEEVPLQVRERWRPAIRKYFSPDAIIYARMHGAALGSFGVNEFIDILLSSEGGNSIIIDKVIYSEEEEEGFIEEINVSIITVE